MLVNDVWGWRGVSAELNKQGNCYRCTVSLIDPTSSGTNLTIGSQGVVSPQLLTKTSGTRDDTPYIPTGATVGLWPQSGDTLWDNDGVVATVNKTDANVEYTIVSTSAVIHNVVNV